MQRIFTRIVRDYDWSILAENSRLYFGDIAELKGPSYEEKQIEQQNQQLNSTLINAYNTAFQNQAAIYSAVKAVFDPILQAGPSQYGFSKAEDTAYRTQASEGTAANYRMGGQALAERMAASGGGNSFLPSGVNAQLQGQLAGAAAESESSKQLGITEAGFAQGRQNFQNATNVEMGVASGYNPLGYAGAATTSGRSAFDMASKITEEAQAASPWGAIGGILGGAVGSFAGPFGAAVGANIGKGIGGAGSSGNAQGGGGGGFGGSGDGGDWGPWING